jgi:hypothetical protein
MKGNGNKYGRKGEESTKEITEEMRRGKRNDGQMKGIDEKGRKEIKIRKERHK